MTKNYPGKYMILLGASTKNIQIDQYSDLDLIISGSDTTAVSEDAERISRMLSPRVLVKGGIRLHFQDDKSSYFDILENIQTPIVNPYIFWWIQKLTPIYDPSKRFKNIKKTASKKFLVLKNEYIQEEKKFLQWIAQFDCKFSRMMCADHQEIVWFLERNRAPPNLKWRHFVISKLIKLKQPSFSKKSVNPLTPFELLKGDLPSYATTYLNDYVKNEKDWLRLHYLLHYRRKKAVEIYKKRKILFTKLLFETKDQFSQNILVNSNIPLTEFLSEIEADFPREYQHTYAYWKIEDII